MTTDRPVLVDRPSKGVVRLTLNRPGKRNALSRAMMEALAEGFAEAAADRGARALLLRGAGPDFCAGADLAELSAAADAGPEASLGDASRLGDLLLAIRRHPFPVVAAVHGRAVAGGCGLALACDLVVADEHAELGFPEVRLGFVPAMVMALLRRKLSEGRAFELVVLGRRISAGEALELGLVHRVFPSDTMEEGAESLAAELAELPPSAVRLTKRLFYGLDGASLETGIGRGAEVNALARLTVASREGVRRFLDGVVPEMGAASGAPPERPLPEGEQAGEEIDSESNELEP